MTMTRRIVRTLLVAVAAFLVTGCVSAKHPPPYRVLSEERAIELADAFLAEKQVNWGKAVRVEDVPDLHRYVVIYPTPDRDERILAGERGVYVSKIDGGIMFMPGG